MNNLIQNLGNKIKESNKLGECSHCEKIVLLDEIEFICNKKLADKSKTYYYETYKCPYCGNDVDKKVPFENEIDRATRQAGNMIFFHRKG